MSGKLVILRPEPGASETAKRAAAMGLDAVKIPLFEVRPVAWEMPDGHFDALVMTSANAVRHGGPRLASVQRLPVHAVGEATAAAAREAGFKVSSVGRGGVGDLLAGLAADLRLLHLAGRDRRGNGTAHDVTAVTVYESVTLPAPALGDIAGSVVLVHSPRAGQRFAELVTRRHDVAIAAISRAAAEACGDGWRHVDAANLPDDASLLALAAELCHKPVQE